VSAAAVAAPPHRLERLRGWMSERGVDACVLAGPEHVTHLAGYHRYLGGPAALVVGADGERTLLVAHDEAPIAGEHAEADRIVPYGQRGFGIDLQLTATLARELVAVDHVRAARTLAVVDSLGGVAECLGEACSAQLVDGAEAIARIRLIPDADERERLLHGYELSWDAQAAVAAAAVPGATEIELFDAALSAAQLAHGAPVAFMADLVSGRDTAKVGAPVHVPGRRRIEAGDPVIADLVVGAGGYWGDTAETHVAGENPAVTEARAALLEILAACASELRPGNTGAAVFAAMHARVIERFPDGELPHHGGHGVSLTAFEDPHMIPSDTTPLEHGMVISLEPGVYVSGVFGARVENTFVVTPAGGVELREAVGAR
jgi:Xaa-Pro aminopeptidase